VRLWGEHDHATRAAFDTPAILRADLRPLVLQCAVWGRRPEELRWLDAPPVGALEAARQALRDDGSVDDGGGLTPRGSALAALPVAPHIARMVIAGRALDAVGPACALAAVVSERAAAADEAAWRLDARTIDRLLHRHPGAARVARQLRGLALEGPDADADVGAGRPAASSGPLGEDALQAAAEALGPLEATALAAMPGRLARRRSAHPDGPRADRWVYQLAAGGEAALITPHEPPRWLVATGVSLAGRGAAAHARIRHALVLDEPAFVGWFGRHVPQRPTVVTDEAAGVVRLRAVRRLGGMTLTEDQPNAATFADAAAVARARAQANTALARLALRRPERAVPLDDRLRAVLGRLALWRHHGASEAGAVWVDGCLRAAGLALDVDEAAASPDDTAGESSGPSEDVAPVPAVLLEACAGARSLADLAEVDWAHVMQAGLPWSDRQAFERALPTRLSLAGGREVSVAYGLQGERVAAPARPVVAAKLQHFFGTEALPDIAGEPAVAHLLAPNGRPAQITSDLQGFWRGSYADVRRALRGRYPKHAWPEDPLGPEAIEAAAPCRRRGARKR
jgi:ATP-dependent helicase HrpB